MKNKSGKTTPTMNRFMKAIAAIMLMTAVVCAVGCKKDDSTNNTGNNNDPGGGGGSNHEYVDLGLPSGTLWATCNVGAAKPEDYGDYFAWGETNPKTSYDWSTYQYCNGGSDNSCNTLTKYCNNSNYGYNGFSDNLTTLQAIDDAATASWGRGWRTPTVEQWRELISNTASEWTTRNDVYGRAFYGNGQSLFLPAAGYRYKNSLELAGREGYYWLSSLYASGPTSAWCCYFGSGYYDMDIGCRSFGQSVRAVRSAR